MSGVTRSPEEGFNFSLSQERTSRPVREPGGRHKKDVLKGEGSLLMQISANLLASEAINLPPNASELQGRQTAEEPWREPWALL